MDVIVPGLQPFFRLFQADRLGRLIARLPGDGCVMTSNPSIQVRCNTRLQYLETLRHPAQLTPARIQEVRGGVAAASE